MNADDSRRAEIDARLRRLMGGLDTSAGFEARLMQRVAAPAVAPHADLRAQIEHHRRRVRRRLRREAWMNGITILGVGACAGGLWWRFMPQIQRMAESQLSSVDPILLAGITVVILAGAAWPLLKQLPGLRID